MLLGAEDPTQATSDDVGTTAGNNAEAAAGWLAGAGALLVLAGTTPLLPETSSWLVGSELLLAAAGAWCGVRWRRSDRLVGAASRFLWIAWILLGASALFALTATGPELAPLGRSAVAGGLGVINWWLVLSPQRPLAPPTPLTPLWLAAVALQLGLVVAVVHRVRAPRAASDGRRRGVRAMLAGGVAVLWTAGLARLAAISTPGWSPFGDPGGLPSWLVRGLDIDGTYDLSRLAYGTDTRAAGFCFGVAAAFLVPSVALRGRAGARWGVAIAATAIIVALASTSPTWLQFGGLGLAGLAGAASVLVLGSVVPCRATAFISRHARAVAWWGASAFVLRSLASSVISRLGLDATTAGIVGSVTAAGLAAVLAVVVGRRGAAAASSATAWRRLLVTWALCAAVVLATVVAPGGKLATFQRLDDDGRVSVVVAGDSMANGLGLVPLLRERDTAIGVTIRLAAMPGCGLTTGDIVNGEATAQRSGECDDLLPTMDAQAAGSAPVAAVLLAWAWELHDHDVAEGDATVRYAVGTPEWRERFRYHAQNAIDLLGQTGAVVLLLTMPCVDPDADTPQHPTSDAVEPHRLEAVNGMVRQLAAWNRANTVLVDLDAYLCPDGNYTAYRDGILMSMDGVHFTEDGAEKIWFEVIEPALRDVTGVSAGPLA